MPIFDVHYYHTKTLISLRHLIKGFLSYVSSAKVTMQNGKLKSGALPLWGSLERVNCSCPKAHCLAEAEKVGAGGSLSLLPRPKSVIITSSELAINSL